MFGKLKALLRPKLAKVATKTFGYPVKYDTEDHPKLGKVECSFQQPNMIRSGGPGYDYEPSEEVMEFLRKFPGEITISDVRSIDFLNLNNMVMGEYISNGTVTITFQEPAAALLFRLHFL